MVQWRLRFSYGLEEEILPGEEDSIRQFMSGIGVVSEEGPLESTLQTIKNRNC